MRYGIPVVLFAVSSVASISQATAGPALAAEPPAAATADTSTGIREAAWSPDSKRLVVTWLDQLWVMAPDGKDRKRLVAKPEGWLSERDPAWSPDGKWIAFAAELNGEFDLWVISPNGGAARKITSQSGDERWPTWTRDGRLVFSHRAPRGAWQLYVVSVDGGEPTKLTPDDAAEWQGKVSSDGKRIAFISDRESTLGEVDLWLRALPPKDSAGKPVATRLTATPEAESAPTWAPDNQRVAYSVGMGAQAMIWVVPAPIVEVAVTPPAGGRAGGGGRGGRGAAGGTGAGARGTGAGGGTRGGGRGGAADPADAAVVASRHGGVAAWSPDGEQLAIAAFAPTDPGYNGDPRRNDDEPPLLFTSAKQYTLWRVQAPRLIDGGATPLSSLIATPAAQSIAGFDRAWQTLKSLYYKDGPSAAQWDALRAKYRPQALVAHDAKAAEDVIDAMVAEQPLIKHGAESNRAVVTSGNPLASQAGAEILAKGGNIVDAAIAVDFALGVVEPDASSIGGDGMALLFMKGMTSPIAVDFKDMSPGHATGDNPKLFTANGGRTANDGPSVTNIPGIVAGMELLYNKYGSKKVSWADILAPAIKLADEGFILDEALPTTIAESRVAFAKYPETAKVFLPGGRTPRAGDRFINKDYATTLRLIATEGAETFYRGSLAKKIADDFAANGGVITLEDLAQYHAVERQPLMGHYRGDLVYSVPPPVSNGEQMIETLQILDNFKPIPGATYANNADFLHFVIESWRIRDGGTRIADPDRWPIDLGNHLEPSHALERFKLLDPKKAYVAPTGGRGGANGGGGFMAEPMMGAEVADSSRRVGTGTTSFALADVDGNMIVFTQTLSTWGGNYYVSKGLGFLYNDHFRGGRGGTGYGSMLPLMRSSSTSVPTMLFAPSAAGAPSYGIPGFTPKMAVGCAGNSWIPASVYNIITNVIDGGMDAQHAIEAPRLLIGAGRGTQIEDRIPRTILADLESRGQMFTKIGRKGEVRQGYASVVLFNPAKGTVEAGAEPRRSHGAVGVNR